jgi:hypothetical protein
MHLASSPIRTSIHIIGIHLDRIRVSRASSSPAHNRRHCTPPPSKCVDVIIYQSVKSAMSHIPYNVIDNPTARCVFPLHRAATGRLVGAVVVDISSVSSISPSSGDDDDDRRCVRRDYGDHRSRRAVAWTAWRRCAYPRMRTSTSTWDASMSGRAMSWTDATFSTDVTAASERMSAFPHADRRDS